MKIVNRRAFHDYDILDRYEAGINLMGAEVKAIRQEHVDLNGSFVKITGSEVYLINAKIFPYEYSRPEAYDSKRTRKLLLHKKQIVSLKSKIEGKNLTIVPISMYTSHALIKVEIALAKARKKFEKKNLLKQQAIDRDIEEALKNRY
jgi:SsrA-binding protein